MKCNPGNLLKVIERKGILIEVKYASKCYMQINPELPIREL